MKFSLKNTTSQSNVSQPLPRIDVLAQVRIMCKESSGSRAYDRAVEAAPEPMCVLTSDQQSVDLERFCTSDSFAVVSIDPTVNLGSFYVTPITYRNIFVKTEKGNHPIVLGPVVIHQTKTFRPFHCFASTLIRLSPKLIHLQAFGTDGESELINDFSLAFPKSVHLWCVNHIRQNVKDKLHALKIQKNLWKEFLTDIFGVQKGSHLEMGLIDSPSKTEFWRSLSNFQERWNNLERGCVVPGTGPKSNGSILKVPWSPDKKSRFVRSSSSVHPHLASIKPDKSLLYCCDEKCLMFKGFSLCLHVIAAAQDYGDLCSFLQSYNHGKYGPNFTIIAGQGMPSGSGRKGGVLKKKRKCAAVPVETRSVHQCLQIPMILLLFFSHHILVLPSQSLPTLSSAQVPVVWLVHMYAAHHLQQLIYSLIHYAHVTVHK